jgi:integrase
MHGQSTAAHGDRSPKHAGPTGIRKRHSRACRSHSGGPCDCSPSLEAFAFDRRTGKKIRRSFSGPGALAAAKLWRADATGAVQRGTLRPSTQQTLREAAEEWLDGAKSGAIRTRSGDTWKPSTLHGYEQTLRRRVLPVLGGARLSDISAVDLQRLVERMLGEGLDPSTVRNALMPVRAIYRRACRPGGPVAVNPTRGLELPAVRGRRDRIVDPATAASLLAALPDGDRALWATALFAGLRRGELLALRWEDVDLASGLIRVRRSYDPRSGETGEPKSRAGLREVPIPGVLRDHLVAHKARCKWEAGLVFGRTAGRPANHSSIIARAESAWRVAAVQEARRVGAEDEEAELVAREFVSPLTLHEARHTFASLMIAAGVNAKSLSAWLGHSSIAITLDRYGHLMPGAAAEGTTLLDGYLARADTAARLEQLAD